MFLDSRFLFLYYFFAMKKRTTSSRKRDHVLLTVNKNVTFRQKTNGFEQWEFVHNALPEIDLSDIDTSTVFLDKKLSFPFMISCMTGGYPEAEKINHDLAEVCEEYSVAMGVGSQRQAIENTTYHSSFSVARKAAPSIPLIGNIGAPEVAQLKDASKIKKLADLIRADAFAVHLNPLQEFLQPEGNTNFSGVLRGIEMLVKKMTIPIIVKEIGAGISEGVARRLIDAGVCYIDVAGAGGTSWAGVEILRRDKNKNENWNPFWDWGIPTAEALVNLKTLKQRNPNLTIIASGGISHGLESAKAIALGASLTSSARPMLQALMRGGKKELRSTLDQWKTHLTGAMFLTGCARINELQTTPEIIKQHQ